MKKMLFATVAALAVTIAGSARAADLPLKTETPFAARFTWTNCYLGGHLGGGFAHKDITDPVQLVQDSFLGPGSTTGITTASPAPSGVVIGGQIGCDYQFAPSWLVGIEGSASGSTMKASRTVGLPLGNPDTALVQAKTDFLTSVTGRLGYAFDNVLLYAKGGVAMAAPVHSPAPRSVLWGWKTASAGPRAAGWNGRSHRIGRPASNTIITSSGIASLRCPIRPTFSWAMWTSGRTFRSSRPD